MVVDSKRSKWIKVSYNKNMREKWACLRGDINLQISITFAQYLTHVVYNEISTSRGVFWDFPNNAHHFIFLYPVEVSEMYDSETSMYNIYEKMFRFDTAFCIYIYIFIMRCLTYNLNTLLYRWWYISMHPKKRKLYYRHGSVEVFSFVLIGYHAFHYTRNCVVDGNDTRSINSIAY